MSSKLSPAELEQRRVLSVVRHHVLKGLADWILQQPMAHSIRSVHIKEASEFLDAESLNNLASASCRVKADILLEAAEITAECQESMMGIYAVHALFKYCDCVARHIMRSDVTLDDAQTSRLIGSYGRRLGSLTLEPTFASNAHDEAHQNEGRYLLIKTVAPQVRRKRFAFFGETAAAAAYRLFLAQAALTLRDPEKLAELRAVVDPNWTLPPRPKPVPPPIPKVDDRESKVTRPAHITEDAWQAAWQSYKRGNRANIRWNRADIRMSDRPSGTTDAMWVIQDALEPEVVGPPMTDEEIKAVFEASERPAIWWHRARPVHGRTDVTSYFGGLPRLAPDLTWPRSRRDDTALPLGAQIDCSQIPEVPGGEALPRIGTLYFFVNPHVEDPRGDYWGRVLYSPVPTNQLPLSPPPQNPRLCFEDGYVVSGYDEWIDPAFMPERMPNAFENWEIEPLVVSTYRSGTVVPIAERLYRGHDSDKSAMASRRIELITRAVQRATLERALGRSIPSAPAGWIIAGSHDIRPGYPWTWLFVVIHSARVLRLARYCVAQLSDPRSGQRYPAVHSPAPSDVLAAIGREAEDWFTRASDRPAEAPVEAEDRAAFLAWLDTLERRLAFAGGWSGARDFSATDHARLAAQVGARMLIAMAPDADKLLPSEYLALSRYQADNGVDGRHQMLGHGNDLQGQADRLGKDHLLLMQLETDSGINWQWGSCGTVQFWIKPQNLVARRFSDVTVTMMGG
ncbi:MAG TPA: DUF1963 domain-containing protein [Vineibacter sp.]|nr:DUF1963 domain-containing protein [Vineibacter sp.]